MILADLSDCNWTRTQNQLVRKQTLNHLATFGHTVLKTKYDTDKTELENKIPDTGELVKKTDYNAKITEIEVKIPNISGLATNAALAVVENEIPNINSLVKKTDYDVKYYWNRKENYGS